MVLAYHCVFGFYGFWLPNDPRGSGSDYIANWELLRYGGATNVPDRRRSRAARPHDRSWRLAAKSALAYPPVKITGMQAVTVVAGFQRAVEQGSYLVHACAILPDHVHLVIGRHQRPIRQIVGHLKAQATRLLKDRGQWPVEDRPLWGDHGWNVFLNDHDAVKRAIRYTEANPARDGKKPQCWSLVTAFEESALTQVRRPKSQPRRLGGAVAQR